MNDATKSAPKAEAKTSDADVEARIAAAVAEALKHAEQQRALEEARKAAEEESARQAEDAEAKHLPKGYVWARILPQGCGKVYTGQSEHVSYPEVKTVFPTFAKGDRIKLPRAIAEAQQARGHVEIMD